MPQQRDQRLSALINKFCVRYHVHSESSYAETEALAQVSSGRTFPSFTL